MKRLWLTVALAALAALALGAAPAAEPSPATPDETVRITILHVNDCHGHTEPYTLGGKSVGGYARLATLVDEVRRTSDAARVLLLHAGDLVSRGDDLTRATLGRANVALLNHLRFDAWTPGNGDFYDGLANLRRLAADARCHVLAANVRLKADGPPLAKPYVIERAGPVRVALFGLCTVRDEHPSALLLDVEDPVATARDLVPKLREEADLVVALTHLGLAKDEDLARRIDGLDLIVGGHSHSRLPAGRRVKSPGGGEVLIVQAHEHLTCAGAVRLTLARENGGYRLQEATAQLIPLDEKIKLDPQVTALIARMAEEVEKSRPKAPAAAAPAPRPALGRGVAEDHRAARGGSPHPPRHEPQPVAAEAAD